MTSKERMLLAILNKKPDMVPVAPDISIAGDNGPAFIRCGRIGMERLKRYFESLQLICSGI